MPDRFPAATLCSSDWAFFPNLPGAPPPTLLPPSFPSGQCQRGAIVHQPWPEPPATNASAPPRRIGNWQSAASLGARAAARATVTAGRARRVRGQPQLPLRIAGDGFSAIELTLRADPSLQLRTIQMSPAGAAIRYRAGADGRIAVAIASPRPLDRARIVAVFDGRGSVGLAGNRIDETD